MIWTTSTTAGTIVLMSSIVWFISSSFLSNFDLSFFICCSFLYYKICKYLLWLTISKSLKFAIVINRSPWSRLILSVCFGLMDIFFIFLLWFLSNSKSIIPINVSFLFWKCFSNSQKVAVNSSSTKVWAFMVWILLNNKSIN